MKKILLCAVLMTLVIAACKKKQNNPSITVSARYPTITFHNGTFFSIKVGDPRPSFTTVNATAYDSFYKQVCTVVLIDSTINNLAPGLYTAQATAKNQYGFVTAASYYVAVTNITDAMDLSGHWIQVPFDDSIAANVQKLSNGLYSIDNVSGVNTFTDPTDVSAAYFAVLTDTTIVFSDGTPGVLALTPIAGDTTLSYITPLGAPVVFSK